MIHVENLTKQFGKLTAVDDLSFEVKAGEVVALWGGNGAGKTTALRCLLGLIPFEGGVRLGEHDVRYRGKQARRLVGFVPQELTFHDDLTVQETLRFYARLKHTAQDAIPGLLQQLGLAAHTGKRVHELSGGLKQRLALAVALLSDPPILMLDEPTANLDAQARDDFLALLNELSAAGKTLLFSSHRLAEVLALADRVLVLRDGRLVADGPPAGLDEVLGSQAHIKLVVPGRWLQSALDTLTTHGFSASRNGRGIWVQVPRREKAEPISLLVQNGVPVEDFEIE